MGIIIVVAAVLIIVFSGIIDFGSIFGGEKAFNFNWKNYSWSCISSSGKFTTTEGAATARAKLKIGNDKNAARNMVVEGSVAPTQQLNIIARASGGALSTRSGSETVKCKVMDLDLEKVDKILIPLLGSVDYSVSPSTSGPGASITIAGLRTSTKYAGQVSDTRITSDTTVQKSFGDTFIVFDSINQLPVDLDELTFIVSAGGGNFRGSAVADLRLKDFIVVLNQDEVIAELELSLSQKIDEINALNLSVGEKLQLIKNLETTLELESLSSEEKSQIIDSLNLAIQEKEKELEELKKQLEEQAVVEEITQEEIVEDVEETQEETGNKKNLLPLYIGAFIGLLIIIGFGKR